MAPLEITASRADPALLDLPWETPLEQWPDEILAALPRGISRHVVRFVRVSGRVLALKEINHHLAQREYDTLKVLGRIGIPSVEPFAVVSGRTGPSGEALDAVLITRHLQFSLPYRAVFSQVSRQNTAQRLLDALAVLLVRLHLEGFYWGDVSLSNTLFRRDAGAFAAYLVDAETGEERYASFLGAPIIHHRRVMGVLVIQQKERRQFDEGEEAFLVTMSAQLAGVIAHAEATGSRAIT